MLELKCFAVKWMVSIEMNIDCGCSVLFTTFANTIQSLSLGHLFKSVSPMLCTVQYCVHRTLSTRVQMSANASVLQPVVDRSVFMPPQNSRAAVLRCR